MNDIIIAEESAHFLVTGSIFALGLLTVYLSIFACIRFNNFRKGISKTASSLSAAISYQLAGEAIIGIGTLIFATAEFTGWSVDWDYGFKSFLRFVMFFATAATTLHLVSIINRIAVLDGSQEDTK